jgi:predicted enzyme related to lactoylglutathione lyase
MSTTTKSKPATQNKAKDTEPTKSSRTPASIVWFEIPAQNLERARSFYSQMFGWNINAFPGMGDYLHIDTGGADASPDGALMNRRHPGETITNYIMVDSVNEAVTKVQLLGGKVCKTKTAVSQMGYYAVCQDTEGNTFAVWERDEQAK